MSSTATTRWIGRAAWWGLLAFLTLEVSARVDDRVSYGAPWWGPYDIETIYEFDELGKKGSPGARYLKWKLNDLGFRGPNPEPGKPTLVTIGASETFGLYESEDREYPRLLEAELRKRLDDRVQVVNIAYPGLSIGSIQIRLDEILETLKPRVATIYPNLADYIAPPEKWRLSQRPSGGPLSHIRIYSRVRELLKQTLPEALQTYLRDRETHQATAGIEVMERIPESSLERFRADLMRLIGKLRKHGVEPVLVTHATIFGDEVDPEERGQLVAWRKFYPQLAEDGFVDMERRLNGVLEEVAEAESLTLVDADSVLSGRHEYFADFVHFTDAGSALMAATVADGAAPLLAASK